MPYLLPFAFDAVQFEQSLSSGTTKRTQLDIRLKNYLKCNPRVYESSNYMWEIWNNDKTINADIIKYVRINTKRY